VCREQLLHADLVAQRIQREDATHERQVYEIREVAS
jgi:hypothetical protein